MTIVTTDTTPEIDVQRRVDELYSSFSAFLRREIPGELPRILEIARDIPEEMEIMKTQFPQNYAALVQARGLELVKIMQNFAATIHVMPGPAMSREEEVTLERNMDRTLVELQAWKRGPQATKKTPWLAYAGIGAALWWALKK